MHTYTATYHRSYGPYYTATIFISSITLTIRFTDEQQQQQDLHWLGKDIMAMQETATSTELHHRDATGNIEKLVIRDEALLEAIKKNFCHYSFVSGKKRWLHSGVSKLGIIAVCFLALLVAAYLWLIPWLGERVAMRFSKEYEISMGEQMYRSILSTYKVDSHKTRMVNEFYDAVQYRIDYPVEITVVQSPERNAFAIPGGHIIVYDAILEDMKTPEELAALLGHEGSHIALRHSLRNMFRSLARKMFIALLIGNESGIASVLVNNADDLKGLAYSRSLETEADDSGLQLMVKSHIDTQGMLRLMELLQKETGKAPSVNFLSTHPVFEKRIANIKKQISQLPAGATENRSLAVIFHGIFENPRSTDW